MLEIKRNHCQKSKMKLVEQGISSIPNRFITVKTDISLVTVLVLSTLFELNITTDRAAL